METTSPGLLNGTIQGLIPAYVQDARRATPLMMAWYN